MLKNVEKNVKKIKMSQNFFEKIKKKIKKKWSRIRYSNWEEQKNKGGKTNLMKRRHWL